MQIFLIFLLAIAGTIIKLLMLRVSTFILTYLHIKEVRSLEKNDSSSLLTLKIV
jgi:hypothetical protein